MTVDRSYRAAARICFSTALMSSNSGTSADVFCAAAAVVSVETDEISDIIYN